MRFAAVTCIIGTPRTSFPCFSLVLAKLLERNHRLVEFLVFVDNDLLLFTFADDETRVTPTELVHTPEGIDREEESVYGVSRLTLTQFQSAIWNKTYDKRYTIIQPTSINSRLRMNMMA